MKSISSRLQIQLIAFGYATLLLYAAFERYFRYLAELQNPIEAQGGMWAFSDEILTYWLFFLFLFPTCFLLRLMGTSESAYAGYATFALAIALTAPLCVVLLVVNVANVSNVISDTALTRLFRSPMVFIVLVMSRLFAHPKMAKRLINWAILTEAVTLIAAIAIFLMMPQHQS